MEIVKKNGLEIHPVRQTIACVRPEMNWRYEEYGSDVGLLETLNSREREKFRRLTPQGRRQVIRRLEGQNGGKLPLQRTDQGRPTFLPRQKEPGKAFSSQEFTLTYVEDWRAVILKKGQREPEKGEKPWEIAQDPKERFQRENREFPIKETAFDNKSISAVEQSKEAFTNEISHEGAGDSKSVAERVTERAPTAAEKMQPVVGRPTYYTNPSSARKTPVKTGGWPSKGTALLPSRIERTAGQATSVLSAADPAVAALKAANEIRRQFGQQLKKEEARQEVRQEKKPPPVTDNASAAPKAATAGVLAMGVVLLQAVQAVMMPFLVVAAVILAIFGAILGCLAGLVTLTTAAASSTAVGKAAVSAEVEYYRPYLEAEAAKYPGMSALVDLMLALIMQEAGGESWIGTMAGDVMQSSESTGYPAPGYLTGEASIAQGVKYLYSIFTRTGLINDPYNLELTKVSLQTYNFGPGYYDWMLAHGHQAWSFETAVEFAKKAAIDAHWTVYRSSPSLIDFAGPINYGDQRYPEHVLRYYEIAYTGNYAEGGLPIPVYNQRDYGDVSYGGGTIATSGCAPTCFAMVASYLTGRTITPVDAMSWCGNAYYVPGVGASWTYFAGAANHFGLPAPAETASMEAVLQALLEGKPVICSQRAGLFTSKGHFIVLRGLDANGKVLVNDPNDSDSKGYNARHFDMASEIHATAANYWIFHAL